MDSSNQRSSRPRARQSIAHLPLAERTSGIDKQNATVDVSAALSAQDGSSHLLRKKTRGKSLGPGGLDALRETNGNTSKAVSAFQPKSILKPTVPLTPPKSIPTFDELRQRSTRRRSPGKASTEALLIDFSTPAPNRDALSNATVASSQSLLDPFSPLKQAEPATQNDVNEVGQLAAEEQLRQEQKRMILERRAARRKSMANRRVSFAPEATLHTWSVMEMVEDSTTSSASNSTRRQSMLTVQPTPSQNVQVPEMISHGFESQNTVMNQVESPQVKASPARQKSPQQSRQSAATLDDVDGSDDEVYSSSPSGDVATESSPICVEDSIDSNSDTDGDTAISMDEITQNTINSHASGSSTQSSLEERLRQAATQAGTKGIEYDEYGDDVSMEIADDTVTNAFQPWAQGLGQNKDPMHDQENVNVFSPAQKARDIQEIASHDEDATEGLTMDITRAISGIVEITSSPKASRRKSVAQRRSSASRRQSVGAESSYGDESMDFTTLAGGILSARGVENVDGEAVSDEEVTMEFTTAVGGVRDQIDRQSLQSVVSDDNETMEMTTSVGGILAPIEEQTEPQSEFEDDQTVAMEMTKAVGQVFSNTIPTSEARQVMLDEVDYPVIPDLGDVGSSLQVGEDVLQSTPRQLTSVASETGSPSLALKTRSSGRTRSARASLVSTPRSSTRNTPQNVSLIQKQTTPTKQLTPVPTKAKTPERTPLSANIVHRGSSPKKLFQAEIQAKASPASNRKPSGKQQDPLFSQDELTGRQTPRVVLHAPKPHQHLRRRSSGIGIDKEGFGSPSVTQLLARRSSIGDAAPQFKLESSQPRLRFEDPKQIAEELDAERAEDERQENGRFIMEQEANEQQEENATMQLRDMIESLSPKKSKSSKLKGRKSLAVGSARGLLGKRPMELDEDAEDEESTPKRLRAVSREGSPVKKIHLPKPPSKEETTGRLTRSEKAALYQTVSGEHTPALLSSPTRFAAAESPKQTPRYKNVPQTDLNERPTSFEDKLDNVVGAIDPSIEHPLPGKSSAEEDKISLQQFLNMTNIHFIELNTTKRRHTMAQLDSNGLCDGHDEVSATMKANFVAAATTLPLLELYQHATKELKSYISTGRKIIRSIENETMAEQPALFREYVEARPDVKVVMDNQFRNGKTNARLQSKEGWYTWRSQLVDGLHNGLRVIRADMDNDLIVVQEQVAEIAQTVPALTERHGSLFAEVNSIQNRLENLDIIDRQELKSTRQELYSIDQKLNDRLAMLETLRQQVQNKDEALAQAAELRDEMQCQIDEANRVRDEHRGWASKEVVALNVKVDLIKKSSGWSLISAEEDLDEPSDFGVALTMIYKDTLRLFFYPSAYAQDPLSMRRRSARTSQSGSVPTAPVSLSYSPICDNDDPSPQISTEKRFFLQLIQSQLHAYSVMSKGSVSARTLLYSTSTAWDLACKVSEEIRLLNTVGITRVSIRGDEKLCIKLMLILPSKSRVDVAFNLTAGITADGQVTLSTFASVSAIYGNAIQILDAAKTRKVETAIGKEIEGLTLGLGAYIGSIQAFEEWHETQCRKQQEKSEVVKVQTQKTEDLTHEPGQIGSTTPKSPAVSQTKVQALKRSPLATKKSGVIQKKIPVSTSRQDKFRSSQREQQPAIEKTPVIVQDTGKDKENMDPFGYDASFKGPAITPAMQEAMMQRTPIKRVGALRRSPI